MGVDHFSRLGAIAVPVPIRSRDDAEAPEFAAALASADLVYFSGGKPSFLADVLRGSASWDAVVGVFEHGGVVAGCSAGAMVLGESVFGFRRGPGISPGLGLVPNLAVIPHFDEFPLHIGDLMGRITACTSSGSLVVVGIDGSTALIGSGQEWVVAGRGVTVFRGRDQTRYRDGQTVTLQSR
jgi:cyanophycinase